MDGGSEDARLEDPIVRSAADAATLGMAFQIETSKDGGRRFLYVGQRCFAVTGVTAEAAMADAHALYNLIVPQHREAFARAEADAHAKLQPFDIEVAMRHAGDGEIHWQRIAALPTAQADGTVRWDGLQIDVTNRRQMADELEDQRRRVEIAVEATELGLWELDLRTNRRTWSERHHEFFGLAPGQQVDEEAFAKAIHPEDYERVKTVGADTLAAPEPGDLLVEYRVVRPNGEIRTLLTRGRVICDDRGDPQRVVGTTLDVTDRRASDERRTLLLSELAHRAKNGIAVMMAMITQTARGQETVAGFEATLMARLQAMATSQDLVTASGGRAVDLGDVIRTALAGFGPARFDIDPALDGLTVRGDIAVGTGLLLHELATNAVKYGALSKAKGRVQVKRETSADGRAAFAWREDGGPAVVAPTRQGFGTRLMQLALRTQGGEVAFQFESGGFQARAEFPTAR